QRLDYDILGDDLARVLDALRVRDATVVAHSGAGGEAVRCITRHGAGRIARLLLLAPSLPFLIRADDNPEGIDPAMLETRCRTLRDDLPKWLADNGRPFVNPDTPQEVIAWVSAMVLSCSLKALVDFQRVIGETDFRAELATLALPTAVIHGDRDVSAPLDFCGRRTAAIVPGATLTVYEGAAHGLMLTHAERLAEDIATFAKARPRRAARSRVQPAAQADVMSAKASAAGMVASAA
ncbi:MAG: alpha/beta hydrolase, partial [Acetobacteraceae bacterium]|nr:alpha/beta hydrolase [Acetobacteraceae bacterium]